MEVDETFNSKSPFGKAHDALDNTQDSIEDNNLNRTFEQDDLEDKETKFSMKEDSKYTTNAEQEIESLL